MESKAKWAVNWKDGMKINSDHFTKERVYNLYAQSLSTASHLTDNNFGLIHYPGVKNLSFKLYNNRITIESCYGITRGGWTVFINEENNRRIESLQIDKLRQESSSGDKIQVFIRVLPDDVNEFGVINGEAFPVSYPDASCSYRIEYQSADSKIDTESQAMLLPFAQLDVLQNGVELNNDYIPPVTTVNANEKLMDYYHNLNKLNFSLTRTISTIAQNLSSSMHSSYVNHNLKELANTLSIFQADQLDIFTLKIPDSPPIDLFLYYKRFSRLINAALVNMENRSEMVGMMSEWASISSTEFMKIMNNMGGLEFNHQEVASSLRSIEMYIQMMDKMFTNMSNANL